MKFLIPFLFLYAILRATIVPSNQLFDWTQAGVTGGIPTRSTVYHTCTTSDSLATIQGFCDACPDGQVVVLNNGTYDFGGGLLKIQNVTSGRGMTLRGQSKSGTKIVNGYVQFIGDGQLDDAPPVNATSNAGIADWTAGYTQGATSITLSTIQYLGGFGPLTVGMQVCLDQTDDSAIVNGTGSEGTYAPNFLRTNRHQLQVSTITSLTIIGGGPSYTVGISPGLIHDNWASGNSPKAYWWGFLNGGHNYTSVTNCGIENITFDNSSYTTGIAIFFECANQCWAYNCAFIRQSQLCVQARHAINIQVDHCDFSSAQDYGSQCYAVDFQASSLCLAQNNWVYQTSSPFILDGGPSGCVIAYNYAVTQIYGGTYASPDTTNTFMPQMVQFHGAHPAWNLVEGNIGNGFEGDFIHGSASDNLVVRNQFIGKERSQNQNTLPAYVQAWNRYTSFVGNVLGNGAYHTNYEYLSNTTAPSNVFRSIFAAGFYDTFNTTPASNDATTVTTMIRKGNWNTVDAAVPSSETLGGDVIPDSYYLSSKPTWFGYLAWPNVVPSTGTASQNAAQYRYVNGFDPPASSGSSSALSGKISMTGKFQLK